MFDLLFDDGSGVRQQRVFDPLDVSLYFHDLVGERLLFSPEVVDFSGLRFGGLAGFPRLFFGCVQLLERCAVRQQFCFRCFV